MKKYLILILLAIAPLASAGELKVKGYIKPDPVRGANNYLIYNKQGKAIGRIAPDLLRPSESNYYRIYDKKGKQTGQIRPDYIDNRRYIFEKVKGD
jgi:uncharacterized protein YxjI